MKKLKSEFKKDETMTQNLKIFFDEVIGEKDKNHFEFIGVYYYKNYEIFFDHIHEDKRIVKHISIKEMAFMFARENKDQDPVAMSEEQYFKAQMSFLKGERDKYKKMYEEVTRANNSLIAQYERQKKKAWQFWK